MAVFTLFRTMNKLQQLHDQRQGGLRVHPQNILLISGTTHTCSRVRDLSHRRLIALANEETFSQADNPGHGV